MKKKLMMVAVLLGALSLGACVDDNESASVTNIRDAKAAQLQAMATLYQAQADAAASAAAAEAQLKAAEAAYQQALADAAAADAAMKEELLNQAQQKFALELQKLQAQYAASIAYWNQLKAKFEGKLWDNENANVQAVYGGYVSAQSLVNSLTEARMKQQVRKAQAEAQIVTAEEAMNQQLAGWNTQKAQLTRNLAKLQAMKEAQPSKDEYLQKLDELETQAYDILNNAGREAVANKTNKKNALSEATKELSDGNSYAFVLAADELAVIQDNDLITNNLTTTDLNADNIFVEDDEIELAEAERKAYQLKWGSPVTDEEGLFTFTNKYAVVSTTVDLATLYMEDAFTAALEEADANIEKVTGEEWKVNATTGEVTEGDLDVKIGNDNYITVNGAKGYRAFYEYKISEAEDEIERLNTVLAGEKAKGDAAKQDLIFSYESQIAMLQNQIDGSSINEKFINPDGTPNSYICVIIEDGSTTSFGYSPVDESFEEALAKADEYEIKAQANLNKFTADKTELTDLQKEYDTALANFKNADNQKAYTDAIAALETPAKEYVAALDAAKGYEDQLADLGFKVTENGTINTDVSVEGTYQLIKKELDGINDVQSQIDACNTQLAQIEAALQQASVLGTLVTTSTYSVWYTDPITDEVKSIAVEYYVLATNTGVTTEDAIALIDANIAMLDAQIEVQQALADKYKAQLDAYLNTGEEPTPETPSEETPSEEQPAEETPAA